METDLDVGSIDLLIKATADTDLLAHAPLVETTALSLMEASRDIKHML